MARKKKKNTKRNAVFETTQLAEPSKALLANIRFASVDESVQSLVITSSVPDEGKTTVATNLALAMASSGKKVLLIDADMRRRSIAGRLGLHPRHGLYSVLAGDATIDEAVVSTRYPNLYFLDSEPNIPSPPDILQTRRFSEFVDSLYDRFDYMIFDAPPVGVFIDAAIIGHVVDGVVLVVREHATKREAVANAIQQLDAADVRILGVVLTFTQQSDNSYYYYSYYNEEGKRVKHGDRKKDETKSASELEPSRLPGARSGDSKVPSEEFVATESGRESRARARGAAKSSTVGKSNPRKGSLRNASAGKSANSTSDSFKNPVQPSSQNGSSPAKNSMPVHRVRGANLAGANNPRNRAQNKLRETASSGAKPVAAKESAGNPFTPGAFRNSGSGKSEN